MKHLETIEYDSLLWYDGPIAIEHNRILFEEQDDKIIHISEGDHEVIRLAPKEVVAFRDALTRIIERDNFDPTIDSLYGVTQADVDEHIAWLERYEKGDDGEAH